MTIAELKRQLPPGTVLDVTMHRYPELTGRRTVVKANTVGVYLTLPDGHPRQAATPGGSFMDWPKASELTENADGSFTCHFKGWKDAVMTFTIAS